MSNDPLVYLLDTPGIMMPKISDKHVGMKLACCGAISDKVVGETNIADYLLFQLNRQRQFAYVEQLGLKQPTDDINLLLTALAVKHNFFTRVKDMEKGGVSKRTIPNTEQSAMMFLKEFRGGNFGPFNLDGDTLTSHLAD